MAKVIMSWSKCKIEVGEAVDNGASMPTSLSSVGTIKDKSTTLEPSDGDTLEMKETGGKTVAKETSEGGLTLNTRIIEPSDETYTLFGLGSAAASEGEYNVATHIVKKNFAFKLTSKNIGSKGLKAPFTSVSAKPGYSEEDGHYIDLAFDILQGDADYWYQRFTVTESDWK